jgi:hypothetical protein
MKGLAYPMPARAFVVGVALFLAACGGADDVGASRLKGVEEGMSREAVLDVMGSGPLRAMYADTMRVERGFRRSEYIIGGATLTVLYYREAPGDVSEGVIRSVETPIVLRDGKALGWGWKFYDREREALGLPDITDQAPTPENPMLQETSPAPTTDSATL